MKNKDFMVYIALLIAMAFWGMSFIWTKKALTFYNPITIIFFRLLIASVFMTGANIFLKKLQKLTKKQIKQIIILSFFEPFLYFMGENFGLQLVSSTITSVMIALIPLFTPIVAYFFLNEKVSKMNIIGIIISIIGVVLVILKDDFSLQASVTGLALVMLAVLSAVAYTIVVAKIANKINVYTIITYQNIAGVFWFLPFFMIFDLKKLIHTGINIEAAIPIVNLAVLASSVAFLLFTYGISRIGVTRANMWGNIIPVFTAIFAYFLIDERLSLMNIAGILIVITGLFLSQVKSKSVSMMS